MSIKDVLIGKNGKNYGFCCPSKNEIWISTLSLDAGLRFAEDYKSKITFNMETYDRDLLTDVMIDEITHIQTGCDHNNERYEVQLRMNYRKLEGK